MESVEVKHETISAFKIVVFVKGYLKENLPAIWL
jgi:hypothetical protein